MDKTFFNFPVVLMQDSPNMRKFGDDVMDYCCYKHTLNLTRGSEEDKIKDAADYFGITLGNDIWSYNNGKQLYDSIPKKTAMTGINKDLIFEFYKNDKSEFEIATLMAFLAIKSILGKRSYSKITNEFLLCRMAGYNALDDMPELPDYLRKYAKRWHMDKIKTELQRCYGVKMYARFTKGFYVSFDLSLEDLVRVREVKRKKYYLQQQKGATSAAVKKVLTELYKTAS